MVFDKADTIMESHKDVIGYNLDTVEIISIISKFFCFTFFFTISAGSNAGSGL